jgi:YD repeat-containing protein
MYAVSDFKSQNGIGGISTIQYAYEEARIHKKGKGFLGFKKTTASNQTMNTKTVVETQFNSYPLATAIYKTGTYLLSTDALLSETTFTNQFVAYGSSEFDPNKRYWQRVTGTNENNAFEGRTVATSSSYDAHGNVTTGTVNNNNGLEITTTTAIYGTYVVSIPNKPTSVTVSRTRSGQSAYSVTTTYAYNGIGQLTSKTDFSGQSQSVTTDYSYNSLGNLTQTTVNPSGMTARSTSSTYDTKGRYALSTTNPLSQTTTATYDPKWGKPLSVQGIDGLTTTYEYDAFGRTKKTNLPEGYSITQNYGWDIGNGAIYYTLLDHPGKPNVKTWYDLLGREIKSETDAFGSGMITQAKTYDAKGNVATSTQPYKTGETVLTTTTTYDTYNRPTNISTSEVSFGTTTIGYAYNAGNLTTTTTNPAGQVASKTTDATGQTISATDHGGTLTYTYNSQGNLLTVVKDGVTLTSSQYDAYGRQTQLTDQNAGTTTYAYDALGQLTSQTNANGNGTTMAYDVVGRITTRTGVEGTTTHEYFANGNGGRHGTTQKNNLLCRKHRRIHLRRLRTPQYHHRNRGRNGPCDLVQLQYVRRSHRQNLPFGFWYHSGV